MADDGSGEKTEEPTHKKIQDTRKKGQTWKSKDLSGVAVFLTGMAAMKYLWPALEEELAEIFAYSFEQLAHPVNLTKGLNTVLAMGVRTLLLLTVPLAVAAAIMGGLTEFLQVGALFAPDAIKPKLDKLNPVQGFKNMFSKKQLVELLKNLLKISVTSYVVFGTVRDASGLIVSAIRGNEHSTLMVMGELVTQISLRVGLLLLVFSIFDVWWQHRTYMKDLMMTKDEVKREYKDTEGDPYQKAQRKMMYMEILESAQMDAVKDADVVVTNPDHVAVALQYDRDKDQAPKVICKGLDDRAQTIKALARDHQVAILRNVPLAHALHRVDVGQEIPEQLYDAVAEVLTFVYGLREPNTAPRSTPKSA